MQKEQEAQGERQGMWGSNLHDAAASQGRAGWLGAPEAQSQGLFPRVFGDPDSTWIAEFWPPELQEDKFLQFYPLAAAGN